MNDLQGRVTEALATLERGWALTPLNGKKPIEPGWQKAERPTREQVLAWARSGNVGLRTGAASRVFVVDFDLAKGASIEETWKRLGIDPPVTVIVETGGGEHWYFEAPQNCPGNSVAKLGKAVDTRGEGGQVVFVGSVHPQTGRVYAWKAGHAPADVTMAPVPAAVLNDLKRPDVVARKTYPDTAGMARYVAAAVERECAAVAGTAEGRNNRLNVAAFKLGQLVGGQVLGALEAEAALHSAGLASGLEEKETRATVASGLAAGQQTPRRPAVFAESVVEAAPTPLAGGEEAGFDIPRMCWRGPFCDYRDALDRSTEASDNYHFAVLLTVAGCVVGRRAFLPHGRYMFPNLYTCLVGSTGLARKSTAIHYGRELLRDHQEVQCLTSASWEGLLDTLAAEERSTRVLVAPGEFRSLATKARQDSTSNLIPNLTECYDCPPEIKHKTRGKEVRAVRPFVSILTASTAEWLLASVEEHDIGGGFLNRWLFVDGPPKAPNARPSLPRPTPMGEVLSAMLAVDSILRGVSEEYGLKMGLSAEADAVFCSFYDRAVGKDNIADLLGQLTQRIQDIALKLAMIYALFDGSDTITGEQMAAGIAFAEWEKVCVGRSFAGYGDSAQLRLERNIMRHLDVAVVDGLAGLSYSDIQRKVGGRYSSEELGRAFFSLERVAKVKVVKRGDIRFLQVL